jgi:hypothetical protein
MRRTQKPFSSLWKVTRSMTPEISSVTGLRSGIAAFMRGDSFSHGWSAQSVVEVYDDVIMPAMSMAEEGRHAGFLDSTTEVYFLENTRELVDEIASRGLPGPKENRSAAKVICLPAKDAADELACQMFAQLRPAIEVQVMPLGISTDALVQAICTARPDVVCISGVPPQATRHVAVRCRHLRRLCPDTTIMAAVWSHADLSSVRGRIPVSEANHVVCTLRQAIDYISDVANPISASVELSSRLAAEGGR